MIEWLVRIGHRSPGSVRDGLDWLIAEGLEVEPAWLPIARRAAALRSEHYHRTELPVSLADCFCLATALTLDTDLATTDPALARLARQLDVDVKALPDSHGRRP